MNRLSAALVMLPHRAISATYSRSLSVMGILPFHTAPDHNGYASTRITWAGNNFKTKPCKKPMDHGK